MCPPGVVTLRVDPSDCAKFYICESATRARRLSCPVCQFFNEGLRTCVPVHRGPSCSGGLTGKTVKDPQCETSDSSVKMENDETITPTGGATKTTQHSIIWLLY